jgi:hypothetical protein
MTQIKTEPSFTSTPYQSQPQMYSQSQSQPQPQPIKQTYSSFDYRSMTPDPRESSYYSQQQQQPQPQQPSYMQAQRSYFESIQKML